MINTELMRSDVLQWILRILQLIWAGTGENTHQRQLGYGDGVYKTEDGRSNLEKHGT